MVSGKAIRVDEANRRLAQGEAARLGECGLVVRIWMCRLQPAADSETEGAVCVKTSGKSFGADARAVTAELRRSFSRRNRGNRPPHNPQPQHAGFFRKFLDSVTIEQVTAGHS